MMSSGLGDGADLLRHVRAELAPRARRSARALAQRDERGNGLALQLVGPPDDRGLRHARVIDERAFEFHGADAVPGDVEHVVHPAEEPEVAVLVALRAVAGEVARRASSGSSTAHEPLRVAVDAAEHGRPGPGDREQAAADIHGLTRVVEDLDGDAREGGGSRSPASSA